jgi:hypothetical protein
MAVDDEDYKKMKKVKATVRTAMGYYGVVRSCVVKKGRRKEG